MGSQVYGGSFSKTTLYSIVLLGPIKATLSTSPSVQVYSQFFKVSSTKYLVPTMVAELNLVANPGYTGCQMTTFLSSCLNM